jgi:hypothetical protein
MTSSRRYRTASENLLTLVALGAVAALDRVPIAQLVATSKEG